MILCVSSVGLCVEFLSTFLGPVFASENRIQLDVLKDVPLEDSLAHGSLIAHADLEHHTPRSRVSRQVTGLEKKVVLMGMGARFEIWNETILNQKRVEEERSLDEAASEEMSRLVL